MVLFYVTLSGTTGGPVCCVVRHGLSQLGSRIPDDGLQMHFEEKRVCVLGEEAGETEDCRNKLID